MNTIILINIVLDNGWNTLFHTIFWCASPQGDRFLYSSAIQWLRSMVSLYRTCKKHIVRPAILLLTTSRSFWYTLQKYWKTVGFTKILHVNKRCTKSRIFQYLPEWTGGIERTSPVSRTNHGCSAEDSTCVCNRMPENTERESMGNYHTHGQRRVPIDRISK